MHDSLLFSHRELRGAVLATEVAINEEKTIAQGCSEQDLACWVQNNSEIVFLDYSASLRRKHRLTDKGVRKLLNHMCTSQNHHGQVVSRLKAQAALPSARSRAAKHPRHLHRAWDLVMA